MDLLNIALVFAPSLFCLVVELELQSRSLLIGGITRITLYAIQTKNGRTRRKGWSGKKI